MTRVVWRLDELLPSWIPMGDSWGAGVRWRCGVHGNHELRLFFANPLDGLPPIAGGPLVFRTGSSFATLSVVSRLDLGPCFSGFLVAGEFLEKVSLH
jgi:hypothetical protein